MRICVFVVSHLPHPQEDDTPLPSWGLNSAFLFIRFVCVCYLNKFSCTMLSSHKTLLRAIKIAVPFSPDHFSGRCVFIQHKCFVCVLTS